MALKYSDYMYSSARIRALENTLLTSDKIARMTEAKNDSEIYSMMTEAGISVKANKDGKPDAEATFDSLLGETLDLLDSIAPEEGMFKYFRYPYDAANLKSALKALFSERSCDDILFEIATVSPEKVRAAIEDMDFTEYPANMRQAAYDAVKSYSENRDPQQIDLVIDRACYLDMLQGAKQDEFLLKLVKAKIDLTNIVTVFRFIKFGERAAARFEDALLSGGELSFDKLKEAYEGGYEQLLHMIKMSPYSRIETQLSDSVSSGALERICDDHWMKLLKEAKYINFGAGVLAAFYYAREYEVKNIRIILAGKRAGQDSDTIRERMRDSYV